MNLFIYKKKIIMFFSIDLRLLFYPGMGDVTFWLQAMKKKWMLYMIKALGV